jgi:ATP-binding cassette subfamily B protein
MPLLRFKAQKQAVQLSDGIYLRGLGFRYSADRPWVIRELELKLPKGKRIGIVGATGSGKSTVLDIVMGLLQPTEGSLEVDGVVIDCHNCDSWQKQIAHVPQAIYLSDGTIAENIAFGERFGCIDMARVTRAAEEAQLADAINMWEMGYNTLVGERGVRLSGGQRQRIGIARALYKNAKVLVLDEATSALDYSTERAVMQSIEALGRDLTILIVAHRLKSLEQCDIIIELVNGKVAKIGTFYSMFGDN